MKITRERMTSSDMAKPSALFYRHLAAYRFVQPMIKNIEVLDIGCSDGYGSYLLAKHAKKCTAIDIDQTAVKRANEKYKLPNLTFFSMNAVDLSWEKKFDVVISFQVIEHMQDESLFIEKIKKSLKKGGTAVLSTPNRKLRLDDGQIPWNKYHIREYSAKDLHETLIKKFHTVSILGLHGSEYIYYLEEKRLHFRRLIAKYDILNLYNKIPRTLTDSLVRSVKRWGAKDGNSVSINDFWVDGKSINKSLDLIALCYL